MSARLPLAIFTTLAVLLPIILAGCSSTTPQMTATAVYNRAHSDIESLRSTATVVRARMKTTLEYAGTRVGQAEEAAGLLRFSLINLGTDTNFVETSVSLIEHIPTRELLPTASRASEPAVGAITPIPPPTEIPIALIVSPVGTSSVDTESNLPRLESIAMASGVNDFGCAVDLNPVFTPQSEEIYVVAQAYNVTAGDTISSRWHRRGIEVAYFSFQAENDFDGSCIWFFIDQTDTRFIPGSWSVEIRVNDVPIATPIAFLIAEN